MSTQLEPLIHPSAVITDGCEIGEGTSVGPFSVIGPNVKIGSNNRIGSHVVIEGHTTIGDGNNIFQFASVGAIPQDLKYHGEESTLEIGNNNIIREYVTLQPGTQGGGMITKIGNKNLFMVCSHVGHDGVIGNNNVFANAAMLAGHVTIGNGVIVGGLVGIHQFIKVGDLSMIGGGAMLVKDMPPYCVAQGDRAGLAGINKLGLERAGFNSEEIKAVEKAYRSIFLSKGLWQERLSLVAQEYSSLPKVKFLIDFLMESERGVTMPRKISE